LNNYKNIETPINSCFTSDSRSKLKQNTTRESLFPRSYIESSSAESSNNHDNIKVIARVRPLLKIEMEQGYDTIIEVIDEYNIAVSKEKK
jgi:hypothetical protein